MVLLPERFTYIGLLLRRYRDCGNLSQFHHPRMILSYVHYNLRYGKYVKRKNVFFDIYLRYELCYFMMDKSESN